MQANVSQCQKITHGFSFMPTPRILITLKRARNEGIGETWKNVLFDVNLRMSFLNGMESAIIVPSQAILSTRSLSNKGMI